jgi:hypothetical protein
MANEIVYQIKKFCEEEGVEEPNIYTEFGSFTVGESAGNLYKIISQKRQNDREKWNMIDSSFMTTLPDSWAISKRFIMLPLNRWEDSYERVFLGGLTCDSDDYYNSEQLKVKFGSAVPDLEKDSTFVTIPGLHGRPDKEISLKSLASIINARVEEILEMVNTELKAYGAYEQKRKLIAGIVLTGGGSNLKNLRQLANYVTGFDARIGFANEYIANDKNQYLKSPEFATSIGLLMESLKIHDKKPIEKPVEEPKVIEIPQTENMVEEVKTEEQEITQHIEEVKKNKPTFGQSILEKVKKFFEEVE